MRTLRLLLTNPTNDPRLLESLSGIPLEQEFVAKISSTSPEYRPDRRDPSKLSGIKNVKLILPLDEGGTLILMGNLGCNFRQPFGAEFFCAKIITETTSYESIRAPEVPVAFTHVNPSSIEDAEMRYGYLRECEDFVFNVSQFDEFMEIFNYYKTLCGELNNNCSFKIKSVSEPYFFIPVSSKEFDPEGEEAVYDADNILIGYAISYATYDQLKAEVQTEAVEVRDVRIESKNDVLKLIKSRIDSLYVSDFRLIDDRNAKNLVPLELTNVTKDGETFTLTGFFKGDAPEYLNVYDMGQKIKVDSIDNSLRLINQGASGAAATLLEYIIGDEPMPNSGKRHVVTKTLEPYCRSLNDSQSEAFLKAIDGSPVTVIKGPPGTGKTYVINAIVQYVTKELGEKVVVSSQTHVAIDNVLDQLMSESDCIIPNRITNRRNKYSAEEIDRTLYQTWGKNFLKFSSRLAADHPCHEAIEEDVLRFQGDSRIAYSETNSLSEFSVIGATTTTTAIAGRKGLEVLKGYDWLIIDEVSKCPITEVLRYLPYVSKIILVGDDFQLSPLLEFTEEDVKDLPSYDEIKFGKLRKVYESSVFSKTLKKAQKSNRLVILTENYRSVAQVLKTYNIFYDGQLIGRREEVRPEKVHFTKPEWDARDVFFVDVKGGKEVRDAGSTSRYNVEELTATERILEQLLETTINPASVTVAAIFPYAAQISKFTRQYRELINRAKKTFKSFHVDTVDAFQGKQADIVLVNTVVTTERGNFLNNFRRINVSMSRAKDKLFIFGNAIILGKIEMSLDEGNTRRYFASIIDEIRQNGQMIVYSAQKGFEYETHQQPAFKIRKA